MQCDRIVNGGSHPALVEHREQGLTVRDADDVQVIDVSTVPARNEGRHAAIVELVKKPFGIDALRIAIKTALGAARP